MAGKQRAAMRKKKLNPSVYVAVLLIAMAIFLGIFTFHTINRVFFDASVNQTMETLEVIRDLGIRMVEDNLEELKTQVGEAALNLSPQLAEGTASGQSAALASLPLPRDGLGYWLAKPDGTALDSAGETRSWKSEPGLETVFTGGGTVVAGPDFDDEGNYILWVAAPLGGGDQAQGALVARLDGFCVSRWLADIRFQIGGGLAYIVNGDGRNIATSREENYDWITGRYNSQEIADTSAESRTVADLERQALEGKSGRGSYLWEGSRNYLVYGPMEDTGWGFYVGFYGQLMNNYIKDSAQKSLMTSLPFFGVILSFFVILVVYANYNLKKEKRYVEEVVRQKQEIQKQAEDLIINEERFRVALAQTNNTMFEYDLLTGDITNFYSTRLTHSSDSMKDLKNRIVLDGTIDDESLLGLHRILSDTHNGIYNNECTIKVIGSNGSVAWYKVSISPLTRQRTRVIGIMEDITKEKLAELDPLTGLLNKKVITEQIRKHLQSGGEEVRHAFLMFDIDNFKNINDIYGHPAGDRVIIRTSLLLKKAFPVNALVGRVGGDEFCAFYFELQSPGQLDRALKAVYSQPSPEEGDIAVTYSCGIALCSGRDGLTFEELYRRADAALYKAKQQGKHRYCFFEQQ